MYEGSVDRKQFVLGNHSAINRIPFQDRFVIKRLDSQVSIAYCPDLTVVTEQNECEEPVLLIGTVVEASKEKPSPRDAIYKLNEHSINELTATWTGHWIIVYRGMLYRDCCGLFPIYMPRAPSIHKAGELIVSNSPKPLVDFYGLEKSSSEARKFVPFPMPPACHTSALRLLMVGEILNLRNGTRCIPDRPVFQTYDVMAEEVRERVASYLITAVGNLGKVTPQGISCALSGGYDSRLNFASAVTAGIDFESFTFVKPYLYITEADRLLPPKIASVVGRPHHMIKGDKKNDVRAEAYLEHAGAPVTTFPGSGYDHYVNGYWNQVGLGRTILDGQCYELAVNYHKNKFPLNFELNHLRDFGFGLGEDDYNDLESHWKLQMQGASGLERRDMIFWSGNINGVYAKMTQEHDLFVDLFYPACNRMQFELLLSIPFGPRQDCLFQSTITKFINPDFDRLPYNTKEPFGKRVVKRIRNELFKFANI